MADKVIFKVAGTASKCLCGHLLICHHIGLANKCEHCACVHFHAKEGK